MRLLIVIAALVASVSAGAVFADTTPPELESYQMSPKEVDVVLSPVQVDFSFTLVDAESAIDPSFKVLVGHYKDNDFWSEFILQEPDYFDFTVMTGDKGGREIVGRAEFVVSEQTALGSYFWHFQGVKDMAGNVADRSLWSGGRVTTLYPQQGLTPNGMRFEVVRGADPFVQMTIEEPVANETHMGVGNIRGWVIVSRGVESVTAYLDNTFLAEIPYGGTRGDVASAFPDVSGAGSSGFAMSFNYSNLCEGTHTLGVHVLTTEGETHVSQVEFQTIGLEQEFIASGEIVDLDTSALTATGEEIEVRNISIAGKYYNARLRWRTAEQGFEIVELEPLDSDGRACE